MTRACRTYAAGHQHWRTDALAQRLEADPERTTFVVGCAEEQAALYDRFKAIILLSAPIEVMIERIDTRVDHAFGRNLSEMARILADLRMVEPLLRRSCTHEIVTTLPLSMVVERILEIASALQTAASP